MNQKSISPAVSGILIALLLIVVGLIVHFAGLDANKWVQNAQYLLLAGGLFAACYQYVKQNNCNVLFCNVFAYGFKTSAAVAAITAVYSYFALKYIMPEMVDIALDQARQAMVTQNKLTPEQIDQALSLTQKFFIPFSIGGIIIFFLLIGVVVSLISAAVIKKKPVYNNPIEQ